MTAASTCRCQKRRFTKEQTEKVIFNAKIARGTTRREWRREERAYVCPRDPAVWHVTSMSGRPSQ